MNLVTSLLEEEVVTLGEDGEACEAKMEGNKRFALLFPWQEKSRDGAPPAPPKNTHTHMCVDLSGGDSELLCSADASGQNCSRIPSRRWGSAREGPQMEGRRAGRGGNGG